MTFSPKRGSIHGPVKKAVGSNTIPATKCNARNRQQVIAGGFLFLGAKYIATSAIVSDQAWS